MYDFKRPLLMASAFVVIGVLVGILLSANFGITQKGAALDKPDKIELGSNEEIPEDILNAKNISEASIAISKEVRPAVVSIATSETIRRRRGSSPQSPFHQYFPFFREFPEEYKRRGLGSGVIVSKEGYILTNNHVVKDADKILVTLIDKREFRAKVIGRDELTEVAVVKIEPDDLPVARLGDSEKIQIGEWVLAIGNPMALTSTVTGGVISALGRDVELIQDNYGIENFIQTDAVINPGNSGGPLVNMRGEVIGINTAIQTERSLRTYIGYGFAIPINLAKKVMEDLITHGRVVRGFLGISMTRIDEAIAKGFGLERPMGVGIAPGGNINYDTGHAIFEATHGTAPKYANQDKVNPGSVILSGVLMLRHIGWTEAEDLIISGLEGTISQKIVTYDFARLTQGAKEVKCSEFAQAIVENM